MSKLISNELYELLQRFFLEWIEDEEDRIYLYSKIVTLLREKQGNVLNGDNYSAICKAQTEEERRRAIDCYCDGRGIPESFRYYNQEGSKT